MIPVSGKPKCTIVRLEPKKNQVSTREANEEQIWRDVLLYQQQRIKQCPFRDDTMECLHYRWHDGEVRVSRDPRSEMTASDRL